MTDIPGLVERLRVLSSSLAEAMDDGRRLTEFCHAAREAADLLTRLSSPVDVEMETTSEELTLWGVIFDRDTMPSRVLRDLDRALAACAAKDAEIAAARENLHNEKVATDALAANLVTARAALTAAEERENAAISKMALANITCVRAEVALAAEKERADKIEDAWAEAEGKITDLERDLYNTASNRDDWRERLATERAARLKAEEALETERRVNDTWFWLQPSSDDLEKAKQHILDKFGATIREDMDAWNALLDFCSNSIVAAMIMERKMAEAMEARAALNPGAPK